MNILKYVWPFFNDIHERVKNKSIKKEQETSLLLLDIINYFLVRNPKQFLLLHFGYGTD